MEAEVEPVSMVAKRPAGQAGLKAVCFTSWLRGHNNPSHAELFARLGGVVDFRKMTFSRWRVMSSLQSRLWTAYGQSVIFPLVFRRLSRRYRTLFTVDPRQIPFWQKSVILDMNDPSYDPPMLRLLRLPQVKAIVVSTKRTKEILLGLGVSALVHVIPQIVPVRLDAGGCQAIRERFRKEADVIVGYMAPGLTTTRDGPRRWRRGLDDLDLLLAAAEHARRDEPRIRLWLLGKASASLREYAKGKPWITLFGYVPASQIFNYVANFDIGAYPRTFVLPQGSFSVKLTQFMACGLPIVSTFLDEALMAQEAGCGMFCRSEHEFARALVDLARSPKTRERLGAPGKEYVKNYTNWSCLASYEGVIRNVLNNNVEHNG